MPKAEAMKDTTAHPIETHKRLGHVPDSIHAGTCAMMGWGRGKEVTNEEYAAATTKFAGTAGRGKHA